MRSFFLTLVLISIWAFPVQAHKVVASAWTDGADIEGEVGLSNGEMAVDGTIVKVFDPQGKLLGETSVKGDGLFRFTPTKSITHHFTANLGAGHVATVVVNPDELPEGLTQEKSNTSTPQSTAPENLASSVNSAEIAKLVAKAVRKEVQPLRKEIASYKEKNDLQSILGGIGYILGLTGIVFYIAARRKESKDT